MDFYAFFGIEKYRAPHLGTNRVTKVALGSAFLQVCLPDDRGVSHIVARHGSICLSTTYEQGVLRRATLVIDNKMFEIGQKSLAQAGSCVRSFGTAMLRREDPASFVTQCGNITDLQPVAPRVRAAGMPLVHTNNL